MDQNEKINLFDEFPPVSTQAWEERINTDLKGADYAKKLIWKTDEGFDVKPYYRAEDLKELTYLDSLPASPPYTRGLKSESNAWFVRQDIEDNDIASATSKALDAVKNGATSLGLNATGVSSQQQMSALLKGLDVGKIPLHFIHSHSYPLTLELFIYALSSQGAAMEHVRGSLNFDPVGYLLLNGKFYQNWSLNLDETDYLLRTVASKLPGFRAININGQYFQNGGSTLVQELAFTLASANDYLAALTERGMAVDQIAPFMQLSFATGPNYFMEIAKLRAARLLWSKIAEQYKPSKPESLQIFLHSSTALWNKSVYDPFVNMLRTTTEGMSAILGNADSVNILPYNISYHGPDDFSSRIARNQQLVLKEESYLDKIVDPAAGSYYVENLTDAVVRHAWELFLKVEEMGGMVECIKSGFVQQEVGKSRARKESDIAQRRMVMLGTNQYPNLQEKMADQIGNEQESADPGPSTYKRLLPFRAAGRFEKIRLATERYVQKGSKRPTVFLFTMGNLAMLRARAGFATNFFGCAGYDIIDNPGFATVEKGVESALSSGAEVIVVCSSDDEYPLIVPEIAAGLKKADYKCRLVVAGFPKDLIEQLKQAGVDSFIHVKSDLLQTLEEFQQYLSIT